jgi:hypothetical protein
MSSLLSMSDKKMEDGGIRQTQNDREKLWVRFAVYDRVGDEKLNRGLICVLISTISTRARTNFAITVVWCHNLGLPVEATVPGTDRTVSTSTKYILLSLRSY